ncbi:MAG: Phosphoribosyl-AMP cyclohydrolase, partial [uncultured Quadrisphaera sp.]
DDRPDHGPGPRRRRAAQARRRRPGVRRRPGPRHRRGAHGGLDGRRGAAPHPDHRPRLVLEPQPRRAVAQGRHLRRRPARGLRGPGLRRRRAPGDRRPDRRRLPHRRPHLLRRPAAAGQRAPAPGPGQRAV